MSQTKQEMDYGTIEVCRNCGLVTDVINGTVSIEKGTITVKKMDTVFLLSYCAACQED